MRTRIDLTGQTFGRLTVLRFSHTVRGQSVWLCRCTCGKEVTAEGRRLRRGEKKSCGCLRSENLKGRRNAANICIDCKKACGGCSWSEVDPSTGAIRFEPVPGWTAQKSKLLSGSNRDGSGRYVDTYSIKACPLFEQESKEGAPV